jgi:protein SCO1/2
MRYAALFAVAACAAIVGPAYSQPSTYSPEATFAYEQRLGTQIPSGLVFQDEQGREVHLSEIFGKRPMILVLAQYRCPMLCNQVLNGLVDCVRGLPVNAGTDFDVVVVSFDKREGPQLAAAKKASYVGDYGRPGSEDGWHFLTASVGSDADSGQSAIDTLTLAVGFHYAYSPQQDRYAHPSGVVVLTPGGKPSAYLYGILYNGEEMKKDLERAGSDRIGPPVSTYRRVLLLCWDYDPATNTYSANIMKIVRAGGVLIVLTVGAGIAIAFIRERCAAAARRATAGSQP